MSVHAISLSLRMRGVSPSEKLVLLVLANYADERNQSFPSHRRLADETGLTERTVLTVLKSLEAKKLLSRQERRRQDGSRSTDLITLHFHGEMISPRGEDAAEGVGKQLHQGGEIISPLTTFEPPLNQTDAIDWRARVDEATEAGGDALDRTSTGLMHAKDLRALCEPTSGEPCQWDEVLDAIRMCAARAKTRGKPIRSWSWVREDALALRDKRLTSANPEPRKAHERTGYHPQPSNGRAVTRGILAELVAEERAARTG